MECGNKITEDKLNKTWFQWPHGLRLRSAAAHLVRLWVRIHPGHACFSVVSVECCQVKVSASG